MTTHPSPLVRLLRAYLRTNLRGRTRIPNLLASRLPSLQSVPIIIDGLTPVYVDLRDSHGPILLSSSPYDEPPYEKLEQQAFRAFIKEGETVFDVGANLGFHLVLLSNLVGSKGRVFAFDPNPLVRGNLERTASHLANTTCIWFALSDEKGQATFYVPEDHRMSSLGNWTDNAATTHRLTCQTERIDDLVRQGVLPVPDFIKCDVEGAEIKVFRGAEETLNRTSAPLILFEANTETVQGIGVPVTAAFDFLARLNRPHYRFFELLDTGYVPLDQLRADHANILAVPEAKLRAYGPAGLS